MKFEKSNDNIFEEELEFVIRNKDKLNNEDKKLLEQFCELEDEFKN
jgi:hypothetical protein